MQRKTTLIIVCMLILGLALIGWGSRKKMVQKNGIPSKQNSLNSPPDWTHYREVGKAFSQLISRKSTPEKKLNHNTNDLEKDPSISEGIQIQIEEIEKSFGSENSFKQRTIFTQINSLEMKLKREAATKIQEQSQLLNDAYVKDIEQKREVLNQKLADLRRNLESNQQTNIASLQLRLSLIDLITTNEIKKQQKEQLILEIAQLKKLIEQEYSIQKQKLTAEFVSYEKQQQEQLHQSLNHYIAQQENYVQSQLNLLKEKTELEYQSWYQRRESDLQRALRLRTEQ